ncbi:oxidoreductase [Xylariales sp. PMI_506]|nr:oxidoreductase [Xylariales sp. PMI_506]
MITRAEVQQHASRQSCWIIIDNAVYDVTDFVDLHPGGDSVLLNYAGKDATDAFTPIHAEDTLQKYLQPHHRLGNVPPVEILLESEHSGQIVLPEKVKSKRPKLSSIISISDFEVAASKLLPPRSYAFFKTGAEDEYASAWNRESWKYIRFRPRVLMPMPSVDTSWTIFGNKYSVPFIICPAGGGKLANPQGEVLLTKAAGKHGMLHWVCNNAGSTQKQMADTRVEGQNLYWQIYAKSDLRITEQEIKDAIALGYKGFALTVDAVRAGKREYDMRTSIAEEESDDEQDQDDKDNHEREPTVKRPPSWSDFSWESAITWLRGLTDLPIVIKGIQSWEDAALCARYGAHPWLSNHGGRQLDGAPSAVDTLLEMRRHCPEVFSRCEVIVDGGVERGADIVKALALGARAVGLGRAFLYSLVFGEAGVSKAFRILQHEIETTMALLGVRHLSELNSSYVDTSGFIYAAPFARARL